MYENKNDMGVIKSLCEEFKKYNNIDPSLFEKFGVKRGLRNQDGSGVMAGLTQICNVHGYVMNDGELEAVPGKLFYRSYDLNDIVKSCCDEKRFGFEEVIYLLVFGVLPNADELKVLNQVLIKFMELPDGFVEDMIIKAPSVNVMNKLSRSVLALYSYDSNAEDTSLETEIEKGIKLIAQMSNIMVKAYQVKRRFYDGESMYFHPIKENLSIAEEILSLLRIDRCYAKEEALLLDLCLMIHAEHGGGNNSTFTCRVLSSSGTDGYSAYAAAIGSLKGPKHGGANIKVLEMVDNIKVNVSDITNREQVVEYLKKIIDKEANDGSGLVYGMGHAVYTVSDPRAVLLKENAIRVAKGTQYEKDFILLEIIEEETPILFLNYKKNSKPICANVDLYSGLVYKMLQIPQDLFTPLFATARIAGWTAHRIEEIVTGNRIIRPAYKSISKPKEYITVSKR